MVRSWEPSATDIMNVLAWYAAELVSWNLSEAERKHGSLKLLEMLVGKVIIETWNEHLCVRWRKGLLKDTILVAFTLKGKPSVNIKFDNHRQEASSDLFWLFSTFAMKDVFEIRHFQRLPIWFLFVVERFKEATGFDKRSVITVLYTMDAMLVRVLVQDPG